MLNQKSLTAVDKSTFGKIFRKPLYDSYCFSNISKSIVSILGGKEKVSLPIDCLPSGNTKYKKVLFLFADAFGWCFFEKYKDRYPAIQRFIQNGVVSKLTTQFPSTTAAQVTTANTGLTVGESGVYEWFYYEPTLGAVISPLLFSFADKRRGSLTQAGVKPQDIFPSQTVYKQLADLKVKSYIFAHKEFAFSPYNQALNQGATQTIPFETLSEALTLLSEAMIKEVGPAYFYLYYAKLDTMAHGYGPQSRQFEAEVDVYFTALEKTLLQYLDGKLKDTLILLSADHGQVGAYPDKTIYLNQEIPDIASYFKTTKSGEPIVPAGSPRDMFLHVKDEEMDKVKKLLTDLLKDKAELHETSELIKDGFFGPKISPAFLSRVGNLVVLPYKGETVWWYEPGVFEQNLYGHHGGLTPEEMETILLALRY